MNTDQKPTPQLPETPKPLNPKAGNPKAPITPSSCHYYHYSLCTNIYDYTITIARQSPKPPKPSFFNSLKAMVGAASVLGGVCRVTISLVVIMLLA